MFQGTCVFSPGKNHHLELVFALEACEMHQLYHNDMVFISVGCMKLIETMPESFIANLFYVANGQHDEALMQHARIL